MKHGLVELVVHLNCYYVVMCSNLVEHEYNFFFAKIIFSMNVKGRNPTSLKSWKGLENLLEWPLINH